MREGEFKLSSIRKVSNPEAIVQKLLGLIREQTLSPGDKLPAERILCEQLGVSRVPLREALRTLQMMNIIDIRHGSGTYIKKLEPESIVEHLDIILSLDSTLYRDLFMARRILESAVVRLTAENISERALKEIEDGVARAVGCVDDPPAFLELDFKLHNLILDACSNRILPIFLRSINKLNLIMREKTNKHKSIRLRTLSDHEKILSALKTRNPDQAAKAMEEHLLFVEEGFEKEERLG